jgi:glycosyltransferase involved in cell wall biosynthesis
MDLICLCHIRWNFVYQRPQHLLNRFAINNRVFVIEEPVYNSPSDFYEITKPNEEANLWVIVLHVSKNVSPEKTNHILKALIDSVMCSNNIDKYILWYYSPMALDYTDHLAPSLTIYDCMDELSAFKSAPARLKEMEICLLNQADVVFTGGHSLYKAKKHLHHNIYPFPSSIDKSHFAIARIAVEDPEDQAQIPHPRFGFYGVIDERFNISLVEELATRRPDWNFIFIGPVAKVDPAQLPKSSNIYYLGGKNYKKLPSYLSGWDVAILPFALNESTKYISPTKTPEYLAAGKPVISTSITDVVNPYGKKGLVHIADTAEEFIVEGEKILANKSDAEWSKKVDEFLSDISWNKTWRRMATIIDDTLQQKAEIDKNKSKVYV